MTTIARVWRGVDLSGSAKARSSAAASCGVCGATMEGASVQAAAPPLYQAPAPNVDDRPAVIEIAAEALATVDGVAPAQAEQRHRDVPARTVDAIVERPSQPVAGHRGGGLGEHARGVEAGDAGLGSDDVGDEAGRDFWDVARAGG